MKFRKLLTVVMILISAFAVTVGAYADNLIIGVDGPVIQTDNTGTEPTGGTTVDPTVTAVPAATVTPDPVATGTPVPTDGSGTSETADANGITVSADKAAPTIVKHPGSEYNHTAGDSVLFTAACSENVQANWYINEGVPVSQIGSVYPGVSATVASTIYNGSIPGTKVTISNLTRASSGMKIYVEFTTDYGILKSEEATITVTQGTDKVIASTPTPTVVPTPTSAPAATPTVAPFPLQTQSPAEISPADSVNSGLTVSIPDSSSTQTADTAASTNSVSVDISSYNISNNAASNNGGYQFTSEEQPSWSAPGAALAVAACGIIAVLAFLLMALYSMGVLRFRFLERLIGGKDYVSSEDDEDFDD